MYLAKCLRLFFIHVNPSSGVTRISDKNPFHPAEAYVNLKKCGHVGLPAMREFSEIRDRQRPVCPQRGSGRWCRAPDVRESTKFSVVKSSNWRTFSVFLDSAPRSFAEIVRNPP